MTTHASGKLPPKVAAWYPASSSDGGAHYGTLQHDGQVDAACGARFVPETSLATGRVLWWHQPVDERHACPDCLLAEVTAAVRPAAAGGVSA